MRHINDKPYRPRQHRLRIISDWKLISFIILALIAFIFRPITRKRVKSILKTQNAVPQKPEYFKNSSRSSRIASESHRYWFISPQHSNILQNVGMLWKNYYN